MLLSGQMNLFVVFIMALLLISPDKNDSGNVKSKAEVILTSTWPSSVDCDVDLWVRGPGGHVTWWKSKDNGGMHLERDDTGMSNDHLTLGGEDYASQTNEEQWVLRNAVPGNYVVNVHNYRVGPDCPASIDVRVTLVKLNPVSVKKADRTVTLRKQGEELHLFRFTVENDGSVSRVWEEPAVIAGEFVSESTPNPLSATP